MSPNKKASETADYTILIVDDEAIARDTLEGHLITEGYNLTLVNSGFQALKHLEKNHADLILLDIMMPHMDGFEVCQRIKTNERWRHIPVILFTAFWDDEVEQRGTEVGADGFLQKPINGVKLRLLIRSILEIE
ncbi:MAG: response regulator [Anaerolineae bacterium]|nr:response regulator [Anaerolineae bacterium]